MGDSFKIAHAMSQRPSSTLTLSFAALIVLASSRTQPGQTVQFSPPTYYDVAGQSLAHSLASADQNGDGNADLLVGARYGKFHVLHGKGDGTFYPAVSHESPGEEWCWLASGDVNGDGKGDVLLASRLSEQASLTLHASQPAGTFATSVLPLPARTPDMLRFGRAMPVLRDLNSDGFADVIFPELGKGGVLVFLSKPLGGFRPPAQFVSGILPQSMVVSDFNGDTHDDICLVGTDHSLSMLAGDGQGGFTEARHPQQLIRAINLASGDFDGDGDLDLAVIHQNKDSSGTVLLNAGGGRFAELHSFETGNLPGAVASADFNLDGMADLAAANWQSRDVTVAMARGGGRFDRAQTHSADGGPVDIIAADFDRDGAPDLAALNFRAGTVGVYLNRKSAAPRPDIQAEPPSLFGIKDPAYSRPGKEYSISSWNTGHGLPQNTVKCLLQTRDGFLWIGTQNGLARFDGRQFKAFDRASTPALIDSNIACLAEDSDGTLWIGTASGLACFRDGRFTRFPLASAAGNPAEVASMATARDGTLLLSTYAGLFRFADQRFSAAPKGYMDYGLGNLSVGNSGEIWARSDHGLIRHDERSERAVLKYSNRPFAEMMDGRGILTVLAGRDGKIWFSAFPDLFCWSDDRIRILSNLEDRWWGLPQALAEDHRGRIWLGGHDGLRVLEDGGFSEYSTREGLSHNVVNCIFPDREGNIWAGTAAGGLNCLQPRRVVAYTQSDGLGSDDAWSITEAVNGDIWVATAGGASRYRNGRFENFPAPAGAPGVRWIQQDKHGILWAGPTGINKFENQRLVPVEAPGLTGRFIPTVSIGDSNALWVGGEGFLYQQTNGAWISQPLEGWPPVVPRITGITRGPSGDLWIGSENAGVIQWLDGKTRRYSAEKGLASDYAAAALVEADGTAWIVTDKGLNRLKGGKITRYTTAQGLPENVILNVLEDDDGWFWLNGHRGIHRVLKSELNEIAEGKRRTVEPISYGIAEGLLSAEGNGGALPNSCRTRDGRLWFPTTRGVVVIDPREITHRLSPPKVWIDRVAANSRLVFDLGAALASNVLSAAEFDPGHRRFTLPAARARSLQIDYASPIFSAPERSRFKFRLEGYDQEWQDAGAERRAVYTNLRPGQYRFQVIARSPQGIWNESGDWISFHFAPYFHETVPFRLICVLALAALAAGVHTRRVRLQRRILRLEHEAAVARERERLARDLHDDIGASLTRIALLGDAARTQINGSPAGPQLERISAISREVIDNMNELVWAANPRYDNLTSFAGYVREYSAQLFAPTEIQLSFEIAGPREEVFLPSDLRRDLFLVLKEALNNILKHARAANVRIVIAHEPERLRLEVQDDGGGLNGSRESFRNGLRNMRERIEALGGRFTIDSERDQGVRLAVEVPLPKSGVVRI